MTENKKPSHRVYTIRPTQDEKGYWLNIGSAWAHNDGKGFNVSLDATPVNGRLVIREIGEKDEPNESAIPTETTE